MLDSPTIILNFFPLLHAKNNDKMNIYVLTISLWQLKN